MIDELEINKSYTAGFLLEFLSENRRQNIRLVSVENINLLSAPSNQKYIVYEMMEIFLHEWTDKNSYKINTNGASKLYYIKPE